MAKTISTRRLLLIALLFASPGSATLAVLAAAGALDPVAALLGAAIVLAGSLVTVHYYYRDAIRLAAYLAQLSPGEGRPTRPPELHSDIGRALARRIAGLWREWRSRDRARAHQVEAASAIIEALDDPLLLLDHRRVVTRANSTAGTLLGDRLVGRDLAAILRQPQVLSAVDAVLEGRGPVAVEFTRPVPVEQIFEARVKPFAGEIERTEGSEETTLRPAALLTLHDITGVKRAEQMRADFVANASHELRTPLATLTGFIETLRGPARDDVEARDRFLAIMGEQAGRMARLVNDLLSLSRIELDEHTPPVGRVDLPGLLRSVVDMLELKAERRQMRLVLDSGDDLPAVAGDPDQLTQVFQNLIDNSINYARAGTDITITARRAEAAGRGAAIQVAVADHGDGIPKSHLPRLTERFYRVDPARSRALGGTGLGLAIVKHIISRHRGRLSIESELGRGSTFAVTLPIAGKPAGGRRAARETLPDLAAD